jgi:hypothetical protein
MAEVTITVDTAQARGFLTALSRDDAFRGNLENPQTFQSALRSFGITVEGVDASQFVPPKYMATWALEDDPGPHPSPPIIPTNPPSFGSCVLWGVTLVAAKVKEPES